MDKTESARRTIWTCLWLGIGLGFLAGVLFAATAPEMDVYEDVGPPPPERGIGAVLTIIAMSSIGSTLVFIAVVAFGVWLGVRAAGGIAVDVVDAPSTGARAAVPASGSAVLPAPSKATGVVGTGPVHKARKALGDVAPLDPPS